MKIKSLNFTFKGDREYIQGPDIFNEIINYFPEKQLSNIRFTAHDFIRVPNGHIYVCENTDELRQIENTETRCQLDVDGSTYWVAVNSDSNSNSNIIKRQVYDEGKLVDNCTVFQDKVTLNSTSPYTFIETIVSMNKHLLKNLFPDNMGKWIFTRINLEQFIEVNTDISIIFKHNMNFRLTKSDILVNDEKIGELYFSLIKS